MKIYIYLLEREIRDHIKEECRRNPEFREIDRAADQIYDLMHQICSGIKDADSLLFRYRDARDDRERSRSLFCVKLGMEMGIRLMFELGYKKIK